MRKFFEEIEVDQTFVVALEKRLVAVYGHETKKEWRGIVWPMASFGAVLLFVMMVLGKQYFDGLNSRTAMKEINEIEAEVSNVRVEFESDSQISEAIEYLGM